MTNFQCATLERIGSFDECIKLPLSHSIMNITQTVRLTCTTMPRLVYSLYRPSEKESTKLCTLKSNDHTYGVYIYDRCLLNRGILFSHLCSSISSEHWRHDAGDTGREIDNDAFFLVQHSGKHQFHHLVCMFAFND